MLVPQGSPAVLPQCPGPAGATVRIPVSAAKGHCGVTVLPHNTVVVTVGSDFLTLTEGEAWDLTDALLQARRRCAQLDRQAQEVVAQ